MDEFTPGNTDKERRGRVTYERHLSACGGKCGEIHISWSDLGQWERNAWLATAEAAFEEGRAFEQEHYERADADECANFLRARGYRVYDPGTWSVAE